MLLSKPQDAFHILVSAGHAFDVSSDKMSTVFWLVQAETSKQRLPSTLRLWVRYGQHDKRR